jgi:hypothetical protein
VSRFRLAVATFGVTAATALLATQFFAGSSLSTVGDEAAPMTTVRHSTEVRVQTWAELEGFADFQVMEPTYLPEGVTLRRLAFYYLAPRSGDSSFPTSRNGIVLAQYWSEEGFLLIEQGWGIGIWSSMVPDNVESGPVQWRNGPATWVRGFWPSNTPPPTAPRPESSYLKVGWRPDPQGMSGPGWLIRTNYLSLDELVRVADSLR